MLGVFTLFGTLKQAKCHHNVGGELEAWIVWVVVGSGGGSNLDLTGMFTQQACQQNIYGCERQIESGHQRFVLSN